MFININEYGNIENEILIHEYTHIAQKHSYDIILIEILQTFFWFNPFLLFYRNAIQINHEFLADEAVLDTSQNIANYQYLLIEKASKGKTFNLTSQFSYSLTKKRLLMMSKTKSLKKSLCKQIAIVPVLTLSILLFSTKSFEQDTVTIPKAKQNTVPSTKKGISEKLLAEYEQIVNRRAKSEKELPALSRFTEEDKIRLETIFLSMSKEQQSKQVVTFVPAPPPLPRIVPTKTEIVSWKDSKIYGIWINNKRVGNLELNKYQNTDFGQAYISKLAKNTVNYGEYFYQVNLMTKDAYETYLKETNEIKDKYFMCVRRLNKDGKIVVKGKLAS